ncbi:ABC transporter permease [Roseivirga sp.]|uniref:ABC transporter permease n=1 Tax=Roseivirga sp. TaxID=1964215 RepID=UPI003B52B8A7
MFKNLLKITLRTLLKNKVYSFINVFGLAIGLAGAMLILHYVSFESSYDNFQPDADDVYRVSLEIFQNGEFVFHSAENYPPVGPTMVKDFPEVIGWSHLYNMGSKNNVVITNEAAPGEPIKIKQKRFLYASPTFLKMFGARMIDGDAETALAEPFTIAISESMARNYFGNENPIGKRLRLKDDDFNDENCLVTGVFEDVPENTHLKYDVLISTPTLYNRFDGANERYNTGWLRKDFYSYIKVAKGTDIKALEAKLPAMVDQYMPGLKQNGGENVMHLQPLRKIHLESALNDEAELNGNGDALLYLSIIAVFIVVIAWVNYVNLATSRSLDRAREVGIRKVLGSLKGQLIGQFLMESFAVNFLAIILMSVIIMAVLPSFHAVSGVPETVKIWQNEIIWFTLAGVFFVGSLLSGFYPALVLSSFKPSQTLKGQFRTSGKGVVLRKLLVVFQFAASAALIIGTFTVYQQMNYLKTADLGFDTEQVIVVERAAITDRQNRNNQITTFTEELKKNSNILSVASSGVVPGKKIRFKADVRSYSAPVGETYPLNFVGGDYELLETLGMEIIAGRDFSRDYPSDPDTAALVTRSAVRQLGFESPEDIINQPITAENFGATVLVIGVVEDYNHESLHIKTIPSVFILQPYWAEYFLIKVQQKNVSQALAAVENQWGVSFPGNPFDYFFLDEFFDRQYRSEEQFQSLFTVFSVLAIVIGCLGLFGLSAFTAMKRTKEIGIRKVLGATMPGLFYILSKEFVVLILISNLIAWPIIYLVMNQWLQGFEYRIETNFLVYALATVMVLVIAMITVSFQMIKSSKLNPVDSLRYE